MREQEEGAALSREEERLARAARAALTAQQRTYLRLYYAANLNQEQIAMLMGRHLSNVCRCLNRAEDNLERALGGKEIR
jgi:DNA-directed RNA polymerase specialized sigma24 family protein